MVNFRSILLLGPASRTLNFSLLKTRSFASLFVGQEKIHPPVNEHAPNHRYVSHKNRIVSLITGNGGSKCVAKPVERSILVISHSLQSFVFGLTVEVL